MIYGLMNVSNLTDESTSQIGVLDNSIGPLNERTLQLLRELIQLYSLRRFVHPLDVANLLETMSSMGASFFVEVPLDVTSTDEFRSRALDLVGIILQFICN